MTWARQIFDRSQVDATPDHIGIAWSALEQDMKRIHYADCPKCGFWNHRAANVRDDGQCCCNNCYHVFLVED